MSRAPARPALRLAALGAALTLGACEVGPDYRPPTPPDGAAGPLVSADQNFAKPGAVPDNWWRLYADPALDRLIARAFAANTDIEAAEANLAQSRAVLEGARNGQYPQTKLEAQGVYGRDPASDEIQLYNGRKPFSDWVFESLLDASYEIDFFGRVRRSIEAAKDKAEATEAARDVLRVTVAAETTRAYAQTCTLGEQLAVARRSLDLVIRERDIARRRRDAGAGTDFEVVRAEALVAEIGATIPPLEGERRAARFQLAALLGKTPAAAPHDGDACVTAPRLASPIPVGDGAALLRRRPDIRRADRQLAAATAEIGIATADLYPRVSLTGFWGGVNDRIDTLDTENGLAWGAGPTMSWSFPNLAGPLARVHEAKSEAAAALAGFQGTVLQALRETEQALTLYRAELDHRAALGAALDRSSKAYRMAHDQEAAGAISALDVLTSEQTLVQAERATAASDAAIVQDQIAVFKALGGGWASANR